MAVRSTPSVPKKSSFRSWTRELRIVEKVESDRKRGGIDKERDRDRVVLKSENYIFLGQNLNSKTTFFLGWRE